jgi:hypothetical protein
MTQRTAIVGTDGLPFQASKTLVAAGTMTGRGLG